MSKIKQYLRRGDTIVEVTFSIAIFAAVSALSISIMNRNLATIQGTLESQMVRNEIDAQAEGLRFIQNAFLSERELASSRRTYQDLWLKLSRGPNATISTEAGTGLANDPKSISEYTSVECSKYYDLNNTSNIHNIFSDRAFVLNTRKINPQDINSTIIQSANLSDQKKFVEAPLYPRIIYRKDGEANTNEISALSEIFPEGSTNQTNIMQNTPVFDQVERVEGIWVISARDITQGESKTPEFFDFYIRSCWYSSGRDRPSTISTTIRLYNPEFIEDQK